MLRVVCVLLFAGVLSCEQLPAQGPRTLGTAPEELLLGSMRIRFRASLAVLQDSTAPARQALGGDISLRIDGVSTPPSSLKVDQGWLLYGDSIVKTRVQIEPTLFRIDSIWFRSASLIAPWPAWLRQAGAVDVVLQLADDKGVVGYVRAAALTIKPPAAR